MGECIFLALLVIVGWIMFAMANQFPVSIIDKSGGPSFFPQAIVILMTILIVIRILQILRTKKEDRPKFAFLEIFKGDRLVYLLVTAFTSIFLVKYIGFIIAMSLYLIAMILFLNYRKTEVRPTLKRIVVTIIASVAGTVFIAFLFSKVMHIAIPKGLLGF